MSTTTPSRAEIIAQLKQAQTQGGPTRFTYHGGSRPGKARDAIIIAVDDESGTFKIREQDSRLAKTLFIERVGWIADKEGEIAENPQVVPAPPNAEDEIKDLNALNQNPTYLQQAMSAHTPALQAAGWTVQISATSIGLYKCYKNGKLYKLPEYEVFFLGNAPPGASKPRYWGLYSKRGTSTSYGSLHRAIHNLIERAQLAVTGEEK
ncbi:MAG: hypothetical protein Q4A28_06305 [Brachymonas sp.]|nr:hypothetical protein [Brachymonas sp.]